MLLSDARTIYEQGLDITKMNIVLSTASQSAMRGRQMDEEHGLKLFEADQSENPTNVIYPKKI